MGRNPRSRYRNQRSRWSEIPTFGAFATPSRRDTLSEYVLCGIDRKQYEEFCDIHRLVYKHVQLQYFALLARQAQTYAMEDIGSLGWLEGSRIEQNKLMFLKQYSARADFRIVTFLDFYFPQEDREALLALTTSFEQAGQVVVINKTTFRNSAVRCANLNSANQAENLKGNQKLLGAWVPRGKASKRICKLARNDDFRYPAVENFDRNEFIGQAVDPTYVIGKTCGLAASKRGLALTYAEHNFYLPLLLGFEHSVLAKDKSFALEIYRMNEICLAASFS